MALESYWVEKIRTGDMHGSDWPHFQKRVLPLLSPDEIPDECRHMGMAPPVGWETPKAIPMSQWPNGIDPEADIDRPGKEEWK